MITYTGCTDIITSAYLPVVPCVQHVHLTTARHTVFLHFKVAVYECLLCSIAASVFSCIYSLREEDSIALFLHSLCRCFCPVK